MKRFMSALLAASMFIIPSVSLADSQVEYFTNYEVTQDAQEALEKETGITGNTKEVVTKTKSSVFGIPMLRSGSFYSEWLDRYDPDYTQFKPDAFQLGKVSFDTRGESASTEITATYSQSHAVEWVFTGSASGSAEFNLLALEAEAEIGVSVARASTTSDAIGATVKKTVPGGKYGYFGIYANGVRTSGAMVYKWRDVAGNSGEIERPAACTLPYQEYETFNVHFGNLRYY